MFSHNPVALSADSEQLFTKVAHGHRSPLFAGCPNHEAALENLRSALLSYSISVPIREIAVTDESTANLLKFSGSLTVRIDGKRSDLHRDGISRRHAALRGVRWKPN
jgi:hypothetical protein